MKIRTKYEQTAIYNQDIEITQEDLLGIISEITERWAELPPHIDYDLESYIQDEVDVFIEDFIMDKLNFGEDYLSYTTNFHIDFDLAKHAEKIDETISEFVREIAKSSGAVETRVFRKKNHYE
jgi:hypothetical protein